MDLFELSDKDEQTTGTYMAERRIQLDTSGIINQWYYRFLSEADCLVCYSEDDTKKLMWFDKNDERSYQVNEIVASDGMKV